MNAERLLALYDKVADAPDAIPRLRRFVLDLAVRGKLLPQDPADEPAAELLKRIAAEKTRLVKAGMIGVPKPIPVLLETPFPIPFNWRWSQLGEIGVLSPRNEAAGTKKTSFVPMPLIAAEFGVANQHQIRAWGDIKKGYTHFAEGDVGVAKITPCFENGKSTVFRNLTGGIGAGTTELHVVRPILVDAQYIVVFLKSPHFIDTGIPKMTGTAGQKRVPFEYFAYSPFPLPPISEQHRIVAKVGELMVLCDRLEAARNEHEKARDKLTAASLTRLNTPCPETFQDDARFALDALPAITARADQIKQLRQTILNLAVRGKLVPQERSDEPAEAWIETIKFRFAKLIAEGKLKKAKQVNPLTRDDFLFEPPRGWSFARFATIASIESNLVDPKNHLEKPHIAPDNIESWTGRLLPYSSVGDSRVFSAKHLFQPGVLLYSKIRPNLAKVTKVDFAGVCSADMYPIFSLIDRGFLLYFMITRYFVDQAVSEDNRVAMPKINQAALSEIVVPVPPAAEQRRIVAKADELMALCGRLEASLAGANDTRNRLVQAIIVEALAPVSERELEAAE